MPEELQVFRWIFCAVFTVFAVAAVRESGYAVLRSVDPLPPNWGGLAVAGISALLAIAWRPS